MILGQYQTLASFKCALQPLALHLRQAKKFAGDVVKRFNSKCGGGSDGKDKNSKKDGKDNLSAVLHGIEDLRVVSEL